MKLDKLQRKKSTKFFVFTPVKVRKTCCKTFSGYIYAKILTTVDQWSVFHSKYWHLCSWWLLEIIDYRSGTLVTVSSGIPSTFGLGTSPFILSVSGIFVSLLVAGCRGAHLDKVEIKVHVTQKRSQPEIHKPTSRHCHPRSMWKCNMPFACSE